MNQTKLYLESAYIEITSQCNLSCPYCYNNSNCNSINNELAFDTIKEIIDILSKKGKHTIVISGGEPFLHPQINDIITYCFEKEVRPNIVSNLTMLDIDKMDDLLNKDVNIQITFDGIDEISQSQTRSKGTFYKNITLMKEAIKLNKLENISVRYNIHKLNYQYLEDFINMINDFNINKVTLSFVKSIGNGKNWPYVFDNRRDVLLINNILIMIESLAKKYESLEISYGKPDESLGCAFYQEGEIPCAPRIDSQGNVFLCQLFDGKENILGNIHNKSLDTIIKCNETCKMLSRINDRKTNRNQECKECPFENFCYGGCPALIYQNNQEMYSNDGQCYLIKYFIKNKLIKEALKK